MIVLKRHAPGEGPITITLSIGGQEFEADVRPLATAEFARAFKPFRKQKQVVNPATKGVEMISYFDDSSEEFGKIMDDLLCSVLVDFRGIGTDPDTPLDGKLAENKLLLGGVPVEEEDRQTIIDPTTGERVEFSSTRKRTMRDVIIERAQQLAMTQVETGIKN